MKKIICLILCVTTILSTVNVVFAAEEDSEVPVKSSSLSQKLEGQDVSVFKNSLEAWFESFVSAYLILEQYDKAEDLMNNKYINYLDSQKEDIENQCKVGRAKIRLNTNEVGSEIWMNDYEFMKRFYDDGILKDEVKEILLTHVGDYALCLCEEGKPRDAYYAYSDLDISTSENEHMAELFGKEILHQYKGKYYYDRKDFKDRLNATCEGWYGNDCVATLDDAGEIIGIGSRTTLRYTGIRIHFINYNEDDNSFDGFEMYVLGATGLPDTFVIAFASMVDLCFHTYTTDATKQACTDILSAAGEVYETEYGCARVTEDALALRVQFFVDKDTLLNAKHVENGGL